MYLISIVLGFGRSERTIGIKLMWFFFFWSERSI